MQTHVEVIFTPAEQKSLGERDLSTSVCVVFDILRATTTMVTALANGAVEIIPVSEISEAIETHRANSAVLLAGERHGLRIKGDIADGIDFHFGNSPREFPPEKVHSRSIAMTTTNGTRALRSARGASTVLVCSFRNMRATAAWIAARKPANLLLICSGTGEEAAYEDVLGAGALLELLWVHYSNGIIADSAQMARNIYQASSSDLLGAIQFARNGRRLAEIPDLAADLPICFERDTFNFAAGVVGQSVRKLPA